MIKLVAHNEKLKERVFSTERNIAEKAVDLDNFDLVLRECLSISEMRELGSFFTGQSLATKLVSLFQFPITNASIILDPACGAGNLLIECSRHLSVRKSLKSTLRLWGKILYGYDINASFIEAAKLRLIIEAISRGSIKDCSYDEAINLLKNIKVKDALLTQSSEISKITHLLMNPPFISVESPQKNYWKLGKVNLAGVFVDHFTRIMPIGTEISAILPEVLRSGSRYIGFRDFINAHLSGGITKWGRFNTKTDVDVFLIYGKSSKSDSKKHIFFSEEKSTQVLSTLCNICIGPLVAYRDPLIGNSYPYFHAKNSTPWQILSESTERRNFSGKVIRPPFVLVKRTSSPNDNFRAVATIIDCKEDVAVENHMIVMQPINGTLQECEKLMGILKSKKTNDFLNERIRLRHLTVSAIKEIPIK